MSVIEPIYHNRNRINYLKLIRSSHQTMVDGGRLGERSMMITFLICEDKDENGGDVAKAQL